MIERRLILIERAHLKFPAFLGKVDQYEPNSLPVQVIGWRAWRWLVEARKQQVYCWCPVKTNRLPALITREIAINDG